MQLGVKWVGVAVCAALVAAGCGEEEAADSDDTPPESTLVTRNAKGVQATVEPGGTGETTRADMLSADGDVRIIARDPEGVKRLAVTANGMGSCHTLGSQPATAPNWLPFKLKPAAVESDAGTVFKEYTIVRLTSQIKAADADGISCGVKQYQGMPEPAEFFWTLGPAAITVVAKAENCCAGTASDTFTVEVVTK